MLTNAGLAGAFGATLLLVVLLQLNPQIGLGASTVGPLGARLLSFYGTALTIAFFVVSLAVHVFGREMLSPGWLSVRLLAWMCAAVTTGAAVLMWVNLVGYRAVLELDASRRMAAGAAATSVSAVLLCFIAVVHYSFGRRGSWAGGSVLALTVAASIGLPLTARGWGVPGSNPRVAAAESVVAPSSTSMRVVLLALDGASLEYISTATAAGRLPNFGRVLDRGAAMRLATIRPTQPAPVWSAVATGKVPTKNGVRSAASYAFGPIAPRVELLPDLALSHALVRMGLFDELPHKADELRAWPVWDVLSRAGISVGVVGWPGTDPAIPVAGYLVTDRFHLTLQRRDGFADADIAYPASAVVAARAAAASLAQDQPDIEALQSEGFGTTVGPWLERVPIARDRWYRDLARTLESQFAPRFIVRRYVGLDLAGHHFLRYSNPRAFGDVSEEEIRRHGQGLARHYEYVDGELGDVIAALGPDDLVLVVSGFGMEPVTPGKRLLARLLREPDVSGSHDRGPDGFLLAYGGIVASGRLPLGRIYDVAPTILYAFGLPLARDMDGYARSDAFTPAFVERHPVTFIPTYDR